MKRNVSLLKLITKQYFVYRRITRPGYSCSHRRTSFTTNPPDLSAGSYSIIFAISIAQLTSPDRPASQVSMGKLSLFVFPSPVETSLGSLSSMPPSHSSQTPLTLSVQVALSTAAVSSDLGSTLMSSVLSEGVMLLDHEVAFRTVVAIARGVIGF
jgi:hypothetical protein